MLPAKNTLQALLKDLWWKTEDFFFQSKMSCFYHLSSRSLALVLPEYSMHYIRATIGDTITQAKCKCHTKSVQSLLLFKVFHSFIYTDSKYMAVGGK